MAADAPGYADEPADPPLNPNWLIAPRVSPGTTIELTAAIRADGLTAESFALLERLAARDASDVGAGPSCPWLLTCDIFHDHGQGCPQLTYCGTNVYLTRPADE